jgi:hypothetical protein
MFDYNANDKRLFCDKQCENGQHLYIRKKQKDILKKEHIEVPEQLKDIFKRPYVINGDSILEKVKR